MSIRLLEGIQIAGAHQAVGTTVTLAADIEARLVSSNKAVYTTAPNIGDNSEPVRAFKNVTGRISLSARQCSPIQVGMLGDSFAGNNSPVMGAPYRALPIEGAAVFANILCGSPCDFVNHGVSGETSTQIELRKAEATEEAVMVFAGINDIINAGAAGNIASVVSTIKTNLTSIWDYHQSRGALVIATTIPPKGTTGGLSAPGWSGNQPSMAAEVNRWVRQTATMRGFGVFEQFSPIVDPASTQFAPILNALRDGVHFANFGAMKVGAYNKNMWEALFGNAFDTAHSTSIYENYLTQTTGPEINVLDNPGLTGSGGLATPNAGTITGTIPASWRIYNATGTQAVTASVVDYIPNAASPDDAVGKRLKLDIASAAAGSAVQLYPQASTASTRLVLGKYVYAEVDVEVESCSAMLPPQLKAEWVYAANPGGGATQRANAGQSGFGATLISNRQLRKMRLRTPKVLLETGSTLNAWQCWFLNFVFDGVGAAVVYVSNPRLVLADS